MHRFESIRGATRAIVMVTVFGAATARARQTDNHLLRAVPTRGRVTIDGRLDEWDVSGSIQICSNVEEFLDVYSAEVAMMYDADALYVGIEWRDPTPMLNYYHPLIDVDRRFAFHSDSIQIHFFKGSRAKKLFAWYYTSGSTPGAYVLDGPQPFGKNPVYQEATDRLGVKQGFSAREDVSGYRQEIRIPWSAVAGDAKIPGPGDTFHCMLDLVWGPDDGRTWPINHAMDLVESGKAHTGWFWEVGEIHGKVLLSPKGNLRLDRPDYARAKKREPIAGAVPVRAEIPLWARRFTIAIDDRSGRRVRNLAGDFDVDTYTVARGAVTRTVEVMWDCLDDNGSLVDRGAYDVKGLSHEGFDAFYEMSFYNPGSPPWDTHDGRGAWGADHSPPSKLAAAGSWTVVGWEGVEGGSGLVGIAPAGNKVWGDRGRQGVTALAADAENVYFMLNNSWANRSGLARLDAHTGAYKPYVIDDKQQFPVSMELLFGSEEPPDVLDMDVSDGLLALAMGRDGIALVDSSSAELIRRVNTIKPSRLAFDGEGNLYCLEGKAIKRVRLADGRTDVIALSTLGRAADLDVDPDGNIVVLDVGSDLQVKAFSPRGELAYKVGRPGGRARHGRYDRSGMRSMTAVAADALGQIWVTESSDFPRRVSVWDRRGNLVREYVGNTAYAGSGCYLHDQDPTLAYVGPVEMRLDKRRRSWEVTEVLWVPDASEGESFPIQANSSQHAQRFTSVASGRPREYLYSHQGPQVVYMKRGENWRPVAALCNVEQLRGSKVTDRVDERIDFAWGGGAPTDKMGEDSFAIRWSGRILTPKDGTYVFITTSDDGVRLKIDGKRIIDNWSDHGSVEDVGELRLNAGGHDIELDYYERSGGASIKLEWRGPEFDREVVPARALRTSDSDGAAKGLNGAYYQGARPESILYSSERGSGVPGFEGLRPRSGVYWSDANDDGKVARAECLVTEQSINMSRTMTDWGRRIGNDLSIYTLGIARYKPVRFTSGGAPVYGPEGRHDIGNDEPGDMVPVEEEDLLLCLSFKGYAGRTTGMLGIDLKTGSTRWSYPNLYPSVHGSHRAPLASPGLLIGPLKIAGVADMGGEIGRVFSLRGNLGQDFIFTTDGLYAGALFKDCRLSSESLPDTEEQLEGRPMAGFSNGGEPFNGWFGRQRDGTVRTLTGMPRQAAMVLKVTGLESIRKFSGLKVNVDSSGLSRAKAILETRKMALSAERKYVIARLTTPPVVDGRADDWLAVAALTVERAGAPRRGTVKLGYDSESLYALFSVEDESPWLNAGRDFTRLFKTGDAVDLQLGGADRANSEPARGDLRIVVAPFRAEPVAVLMRPHDPTAPENLSVNYRSPVAQHRFDRVELRDDIACAVTRAQYGHVVELAIPLKVIGVTPGTNTVVGGDVGIISSDARGIVNVARTYWSNKQTNLVNDLPQESWLYPLSWGEFGFGKGAR